MSNPRSRQKCKTSLCFLLRRFLILYLPLSLTGLAVAFAFYTNDQQARKRVFTGQERFNIAQQQILIRRDIKSIVSDLMVLAAHLQNHQNHQHDLHGNVTLWDKAAEELFLFAGHKKIYDQVRYLDETGMERIRINYNNGKPEIVPEARLQDKSRRYYFQDTFRLARGEIFVSPFDLNIEKGIVEEPYKPMIRFGAPLFDRQGHKFGVVLLNYLGAEILADIDHLAQKTAGRIMLLNSDGYWMRCTFHEEWGFMFPDKRNQSFARFYPDAWHNVRQEEEGQLQTERGLYTFTTIRPLLEGLKSSSGSPEAFAASKQALGAQEYYWKLVSFVPQKELDGYVSPYRTPFILANIALALLVGIGCALAARFKMQQDVAEIALAASEEKFRTLADFTYDWEYWLGPDGKYVYTSPSCKRLTGYSQEEFYNKPDLFNSLVHSEDRESFLHHMEEEFSAPHVCQVDFRIITKTGEEKWISHTCQPVYAANGDLLGRRASNRDISKRVIAEQHLKKIATHDDLTRLPNRNLLFDRLIQALARAKRHNAKVALLFVDLDRFKKINDSLGHEAGDLVLKETARRMTKTLREEDTVARMGGDEFVIVLQDIHDTGEAELVAEKLLDAIGQPIAIETDSGSEERVVGASIGVSLFPQDGSDAGTLISRADSAMYAAKQAGRNRHCVAGREGGAELRIKN